MALMICYTRDGVVDWRDKAIYLDQQFYELLFGLGRASICDGILAEIANLRYGDDIVLSPARLKEALGGLVQLVGSDLALHPQFEKLSDVIRSAVNDDIELAVAGDMHPELR